MKNGSLIIRFKRVGRYKRASFAIVLVYKKSRRNTGLCIEKLGYYNPFSSENCFCINSYRLGYWLNKGAKINKNVIKYLAKSLIFRKEFKSNV